MTTDESKTKITEKEYKAKLRDTTGTAITAAVLASIGAAGGIPLILWKLKFIIPSNVESRLALGLISAMPAGYFAALHRRTKSLEDIEKNYTF